MFGRLYGNTYGSRRKELERASSISQAQIDEAVKIAQERTGEREKMVAAREKNVYRIVEAAEAAISCIEDEKPKLAKALRQKIDDAINGRVGTY